MNEIVEDWTTHLPDIEPEGETPAQTKPKSELPTICDAHSFVAEPKTLPLEIVEGILHQGSKLVLGGGSKSFKTWCLLDMAIAVATGSKWLGFNTRPGRVLYINFEIQPAFFSQRITSVTSAKGIKLQPGQLDIWNLRGYAADFETLVPQIETRTAEAGYALIILDPIYKLYGQFTDENNAGDIAKLLRSIEQLAVRTSAAVAFGAHFSKGNQSQKESIDRISGSGVFARDPDSLLILTRHEEDDAFTVEATLRNLKPMASFCVRWQFPLMRPDYELDPAKLKQVAGRKREHDPKKLLRAIAHTSKENPISIAAWATAGNIPRQTLTDYMPEMRIKKWVQTVGAGNTARQYITNEGKAFINQE